MGVHEWSHAVGGGGDFGGGSGHFLRLLFPEEVEKNQLPMKLLRKFLKVAIASAALAAMAPSPLFACAACYGGPTNSPLASGMNWGIFTLLGIIVTVLVGFASFFIYLIRRETAQAREAMAMQQNLSEAKV
jgi:hypothetical protein